MSDAESRCRKYSLLAVLLTAGFVVAICGLGGLALRRPQAFQRVLRWAHLRTPPAEVAPADADAVFFTREVQPILRENCLKCHGPEKQKGGLRFDVRQAALTPGASGETAIVPGDIAKSTMLHRIVADDPDEQMPPEGQRLPQASVEILQRWVARGAPWPADQTGPAVVAERSRHWSFQPLAKVTVPPVRQAGWAVTPIDDFILAGQEAKGLHPNPEAPRRTLIRRLYFDVLGLPPTPDQVHAFEQDSSPAAYEHLVDRLLADPHYGERWGRHWLDAARYADSSGYEEDRPRPNAYHYRDFVIHALNDDLPYDRFIQWQIAGDLLAPRNPQALAATGFITAGPDDNSTDQAKVNQFSPVDLDDIVSTTGSAVLGLTLGCARCHDHKFDPIPTADYYRLSAFFMSAERVERPVKGGKAPGVKEGPEKKTHVLLRGNPAQPGPEVQADFLSVFAPFAAPPSLFARLFHRTHSRKTRADLAQWLTDVDHGAGALTARVAVNRIWQHHFGRGLVETPGDFGIRGAPPTNPALLDWLASELTRGGWRLKPLQKEILMSAVYRQDLTCDDARVAIDPDNRLWWRRETQPVEAEILRDSILSVSGCLNAQSFGPAVKPRISPEAISILNRKKHYDEWPADVKDGPVTWRRSIYIFAKRSNLFPFLQVFDAPNSAGSCTRRIPTTVAPQALTLLNDPFMREQAWAFAVRLSKLGGSEPQDRVGAAFELALGRDPRPSELAASLRFIEEQTNNRRVDDPGEDAQTAGVADFCQALLALNEFSYID